MSINDIIVAPATSLGGAIAVIRVSGVGSIACCDSIFKGRKPLAEAKSHTIHYGTICDGERVVDDVVVAIFRAPHSYTGEESVEISIHGSRYIASEVIRLLCEGGARMAEAGEFSQRALAAGRIDLSQAEAVADLIAAESRAAHAIAATQMRGGYSEMLDALREELLNITTLLELELDFSEEDVEFADRERLLAMLEHTDTAVVRLVESFRVGNAIREGVSVAIVGRPNVGKSTLLNRLVGDDRAMVSEIAGTTRDTIEESIVIDDIRFRFVDTAGLHDTDDRLEKMGIPREDAAMLLPLGMTTRVVDKRNLRNLIDMSRQRMCQRAYWEFQVMFSDIKDALCLYSDEWAQVVAKTFMPKCAVLGYCPEKHGCNKYPKAGERNA